MRDDDPAPKYQLIFTPHAQQRCAHRNMSADDVLFVVQHGKRERTAGAIFCQMRRKHIPRDYATKDRYTRLQGATVVLCPCGLHVLTLYRNERAFKADRCKTKYRQGNCPYCDDMRPL